MIHPDGSPHQSYRRQLDLIAEMSRLFAASGEMNRVLRQELELAAQIQQGIRVSRGSGDAPILGVTLPAQEISGDFFDIAQRPDGLVGFAIGDVSGKGYEAAQLMALTSSLFRHLLPDHDRPGPLLAALNERLCEASLGNGRFVTMIAGLFHPASGCVLLANAGQNPALLQRPDGGFQSFAASVPPLGIEPALVPPDMAEHKLCLGGGSLYLYTDGLTEIDGLGDVLDENGLCQLIGDVGHLPPPLRLEALVGRVAEPDQPPRDDLTLLLVGDARPLPLLFHQGRLSAETLAPLRAEVRDAVRRLGWPAETIADLVLAIGEACQNIIRHGYGGPGEIILQLHLDQGSLLVQLIDFAPTADLVKLSSRPLEKVAPGGLGLHLMRRVMDTVIWLPPPPGAGNFLQMSKQPS